MKRQRKGYLFELRVKAKLEREGWAVFRCARSKPIDLIAIKDDEIRFIECKASNWIAVDKLDKLIRKAQRWGVPIHLYKKTRDGSIVITILNECKGVLKYGN